MRFTRVRYGRSRWLFAATAAVVLGGAASLHAAERPRLYIEPITGLTTVRHVAPESITVPVGMVLSVSHQLPTRAGGTDTDVDQPGSGPTASVPHAPIRWLGATEIDRSSDMSRAELAIEREGDYTVEATVADVDGTTVHNVLRVRAVDLALDRIAIRRAVPRVDDRSLTEESTNWETMQAYFGESIAPLVPLAASREGRSRGAKPALSRFRTSISRTIRFDLRTDPPGFESLMEVRAAGLSPYLAESNPQYFVTSGVHRVSVGPPRVARDFEIETYEVLIVSHTHGVDIVPEGQPITFEAVTVPPGYESEINWVSSTKFGTARPVVGRGPTFTTRFDDAWGSSYDQPEILMQWLGVKANNAVFGVDPEPTGACCLGFSSCSAMTAADCAAAEGAYIGSLVLCGAVDCTTVTRCKYITTAAGECRVGMAACNLNPTCPLGVGQGPFAGKKCDLADPMCPGPLIKKLVCFNAAQPDCCCQVQFNNTGCSVVQPTDTQLPVNSPTCP